MLALIADETRQINLVETSPPGFLLNYPNGVYSTALVTKDNDIIDFTWHIERLERNFLEMHNISFVRLKEQVHETLANLFKEAKSKEHYWDTKRMLVLVATLDKDDKCSLKAYLKPLPLMKLPAASSVSLSGPPRSLPRVKACRWAIDRKPFEEARPDNCSEVLLVDTEGAVVEGLLNNFFVVTHPDPKSGRRRLLTAGPQDPSLEGIMARRVLEAAADLAEKLDLDVETSAPNIKDRETWAEAFMTNCIRGVQPISSFVCAQERDGLPKAFDLQLTEPFPGPVTWALSQRTAELHERTPLDQV